MPSTFLDLFVAKVAIQLDLLDPPGACAALRAVDQSPGDLLQHLGARLAVPPATVRLVDRHARRCLFLKGEAIYLRFLREQRWVDDERLKPYLWQVRAHPPDGRDVRLGELLVRDGVLTADQDREVNARSMDALERDNQAVTARYRERGYQGVEQNSQTVAEVVQAAQGGSGGPARSPRVEAAAAPAPAAAGVGAAAAPRGRELAGDLGLSRDTPLVAALAETAIEPGPPGAIDERTTELPGVAAPGPAQVAPELSRTGLFDKYDVLRKLGEGGMGAVYLAYARDDAARARPVALKVVLDIAKSQDAAARFKREILATSFCAHENIIEIYDAAETADGSFYMAMEYVAGEQLDEVLKREGPLTLERVVDFVEQALQGLEAIHAANIVHRDIKPQNFRIWRDAQGRERLKIMDFGIARILDADDSGAGDQFYMTMAGKITGSPAYIAPECIVGGEGLDGRADLYSLGIAIFRVATGRLPFVAKTPDEFLPMHLYKKPPALRELLPDAPPELEAFAARLLEKTPPKRFANATEALRELRDRVRPALVREGLAAPPPQIMTGESTTAERTPPHMRGAPPPPVLEATAPDQNAVPFDPMSGAGATDQVRGPATPRAALPHEVAETEHLEPGQAAELMADAPGRPKAPSADHLAVLPAGAGPPPPKVATPEAFAETAEGDERSPVADPPRPAPGAPAGGGKTKLLAVGLLLLLLLGVGAVVAIVMVTQQKG